MKSTLELRDQLGIYNNPFQLKIFISGNEEAGDCFVNICSEHENSRVETFYQSWLFDKKSGVVDILNSILRSVIYNCEKISAVVDNIGPGNNGRYLTIPMVEKIISTLSEKDTWRVDTGTNVWKKNFLVKEDGLVAGQKITLEYLSGKNKGSTVQKLLDWDIKEKFTLRFAGELVDNNVVQKVEKKEDGSFHVTTNKFDCLVNIIGQSV
jgi:hypothetical protein